MMAKVFFDTSVLLASLHSPTGGSSELLRYAIVGEIDAVVSDDVIDEVARHIQRVRPELRSLFLKYIAVIRFTVVSVTPSQVQWATAFTDPKDSFIVAAAHESNVEYLVTLDKRHLLNRKSDIEPHVRFIIARPEEVLKHIRAGS